MAWRKIKPILAGVASFLIAALALTGRLFPTGPHDVRSAPGAQSAANLDPVESGPRRPHRPPAPGEVREMTIKRLGNFNYGQLGTIPDDVRGLNGMKVRLRGYVMLTNASVHLSHFALVPSLTSCCFGKPPGIEHTVLVSCAAGQEFDPDPSREMLVEGKLRVGEVTEDGVVVALYGVTEASVKPIAG